MKRIPAILIGVLLAVLASLCFSGTAQAQYISGTPTWVGTIIKNSYDYFYGTYVYAGYKTGSTALIAVSVYSDYYVGSPYYTYRPINVSAVIVGFDWGVNYTSTDVSMTTPYQIPYSQTHTFQISFTVPDTTVATNLALHSYQIYVELANATAAPNKKIYSAVEYSGTGFADYSADQGDSMNLARQWSAYGSLYFSTANASSLYKKAQIEEGLASNSYQSGSFTDSKTHYTNALSLVNQALTAEVNRLTSTEDLSNANAKTTADASMVTANAAMVRANASATEADAAKTSADAALTNAYGWMAIGIGWILIGIGVIVYGLRRPKPAT
jgi:hypothetical protein